MLACHDTNTNLFADCATSVIDLAFLIDGSGSICDSDESYDGTTCNNWRSVQTFLKNAVRQLGVGPKNARISFVLFSNDGILKANLNEYVFTITLANESCYMLILLVLFIYPMCILL